MRKKYTFREPLLIDDEGLYITVAQMQFFLNRPRGKKKFSNGEAEFFSYYSNCRMYNLIYDMMDKDVNCAKMYWDPHTDAVALAFPMKGKVANILSSITHNFGEDDEEEEDLFGLFD
jgi:hypothetical protein